jgi:hypothetical protein
VFGTDHDLVNKCTRKDSTEDTKPWTNLENISGTLLNHVKYSTSIISGKDSFTRLRNGFTCGRFMCHLMLHFIKTSNGTLHAHRLPDNPVSHWNLVLYGIIPYG